MAKTALEDLRRQVDAIQRQAFEAGYAGPTKPRALVSCLKILLDGLRHEVRGYDLQQ
jgi:hypothetical protein